MVQGKKSGLHHAELQRTRIKKDEEAVSAVVHLIEGWVNPFAEKQDHIIISTARTAARDITSDLMKAHEIGEQYYSNFKEERLEKDPPAKQFHDSIPANKLKTFSNLCKKKEVKSCGRVIILKADRSLFGRIIVMAQGRNLKMEDILSHPLGPLPWALSTHDGLLRKTNKATLARPLQKNVAVAEQFPGNSASVVDGMKLVQRVKGDQATFGDDTVSAFTGKGKAKALKLLSKNKEIQDTFFKLGQEWDLSPDLMNKLEAYTSLLYAPKTSSTKIKDLRYRLFCAKKGEIESHQLPPCRDCVEKHALRANYQAGIWRICLEQNPQVPSPVGRGWKIEKEGADNQLIVHWMDGQPAPQAVLDLLACNCPRECELPRCECMANGLICADCQTVRTRPQP